MLQVIFGDDEHTATEGPYSRVMKTRKWLYFGALALMAVESGLYDENAAAASFKFIDVPASTLSLTFTIGLIYLIIQYSLLLFQLITTYDITLSERFTYRRAEELQAARDRERAAKKSRDELYERHRAHSGANDVVEESEEFGHIQETLHDARETLKILYGQRPADRLGYVLIEVLIDLFRIVPPAVLAVIAFFY